MTNKKRRLTKQGKLIIGAGLVLVITIMVASMMMLKKPKDETITVQTNAPIQNEVVEDNDELKGKYNPIYEKYAAINEDYVAYLEWENNLLYNYGEDSVDPYPNVIVRSKILDHGEGDVNAANNEYMRHDIAHEERSFGQDFMDGENALDSNGAPTDQNVIIYGHYVYEFKYGVDNLKFTPLHKFKDSSIYDQYDTFTVTFKNQQRTYQVAHAFLYNKSLFMNRQDSPLALNYTEEELNVYMDKIDSLYGDFLDTGIVIGPEDNFITLQTCVENREDQLFFVIAKEISRVDF